MLMRNGFALWIRFPQMGVRHSQQGCDDAGTSFKGVARNVAKHILSSFTLDTSHDFL